MPATPAALGTPPTPPIHRIRAAVAGLPDSGIVDVVNYGRERPGLIGLWVGEGDLATPAPIGEAATAALRDGQTFYTYQRGIPPVRAALADYLSGLHDGLAVPAERVFLTSSGMQAIMLSAQMLVEPGDEVVMLTPVWPNIFNAVAILGGRPVPVPMDFSDAGWSVDFDRLAAACGPRTKAVFVNTPSNPTGWMMPEADMRRLVDLVRARGLWLIADEVYSRITYDGSRTGPSFLTLMEPEEPLLVVNSFSKNWAMTGWRVGWLVAPASLGQVIENLIQYNISGVPTFLQYGALAAVTQGASVVEEMRARCAVGRDLVSERLGRLPRVRYAPPTGSFYAFFKVDGEPDCRALAYRLVDEAGVGLAPGSAFGPGGEGFLRLCFACSEGRLGEAMDRLDAALR